MEPKSDKKKNGRKKKKKSSEAVNHSSQLISIKLGDHNGFNCIHSRKLSILSLSLGLDLRNAL